MAGSTAQFQVVLDAAPGDVPGAFRIYLGRPAPGEDAAAANLCVVDAFDPAVLARLRKLDPRLFASGLAVVVSSRDYPAHREFMDQAIKLLALAYCKFVHYPRLSVFTPDPFNLRTVQGVNLALEISKLRNLPLFVRHPLADKLAAARLGRPVLLLLPGPSLRRLGPRLTELARACLVVCLARSLRFCREHGVTPDFVVQLDVHSIQPHFYPDDMDFGQSALVCLSLAAVSGLAERFGRVFHMDSFEPAALPNPFRMRDSWLSSLISCLGLAEVLAAPEVYLAGADLCLGGQGERYAEDAAGAAEQDLPQYPALRPVQTRGLGLLVPDRAGRAVQTTLPYFATAAEAEDVAREMARATGARFFSLTEAGILDPGVFRPARPEDLAAREDLDREAVRALLDRAGAVRESIDFLRLKVEYLKRLESYDANLALLLFALRHGEPEKLGDNLYVRGAEGFWDYVRSATPRERVELAARQLEEARELVRRGVVYCDVQAAIRRGRPVWLLCLEHEASGAAAEAAAAFPGVAVLLMAIWARPGPPPELPGVAVVEYAAAFDQLKGKKPLLVTRHAQAEYAYLFRSLPLPHWLGLGDLPAD